MEPIVNLQTLKLDWCVELEFSIEGLAKLVNLRHLTIFRCKAFDDGMPIGLDRLTALQSLSNFIVGNDNDKRRKNAKLNELKELNLRHKIDIKNLNLVQDVEGESKEINLKAKKCLKSLKLSWGFYVEMKNSDSLQLLENLCPQPNLKQLEVDYYPGVRFSSWLPSLANLLVLKISSCQNCQYLPALEGFISLKTLEIEEMDALEYICYEGCSSSIAVRTTNFFPSLEYLKFHCCENFKGWQREADVNNKIDDEKPYHSLPQFPRLLDLEIIRCPNLNCMPTFPNLMKRLALIKCSMKPLTDTLEGSSSSCATEESEPSLSNLEYLCIGTMDIEALPKEWIQNLTFLKHLDICYLSSLKTVFGHMRHLPSLLEELNIWGVDNLDSWSGDKDFSTQYQALRCLHSLQTIEIGYSDNLKALPKWICDLQSLQCTKIKECPNLESLPEGMHRLTNLQTLSLDGVPILEERCKRGTGAEWPKIAHIPNILVDRLPI